MPAFYFGILCFHRECQRILKNYKGKRSLFLYCLVNPFKQIRSGHLPLAIYSISCKHVFYSRENKRKVEKYAAWRAQVRHCLPPVPFYGAHETSTNRCLLIPSPHPPTGADSAFSLAHIGITIMRIFSIVEAVMNSSYDHLHFLLWLIYSFIFILYSPSG